MYILGINAYHGDSSACLLYNGKVIVAAEEERFKRIKHWAGFPIDSIKYCLYDAGININDVDAITISRDPYANIQLKAWNAIKNKLDFKNILNRVKNIQKAANIKQEFEMHFEDFKNIPIYNIEHHKSHIASSYFVSPYDHAALLSIDGFGDFSSAMMGYGKGNSIHIEDKVLYPHSLGLFYTAFTQYLGFPNYGDEYKVMGLAPYGKPIYKDEVYKVIELTQAGKFKLNLDFFNHTKNGVNMSWEAGVPHVDKVYSNKFEQVFGPTRSKEESLSQEQMDLASSVQTVCEEVVFHMLNHLHTKYKVDSVCVSGGVAQNSVANGKITSNTLFKNVYIPPAAHDAGTCIGSALYLHHQLNKQTRTYVSKDAYYGFKPHSNEIEEVLIQNKIDYTYYEDKEELIYDVVQKLLDRNVVGWYQGRAEFGPRALGHRSIIVDPRRADAKDLLNEKIKRRESFRPFAPSILKEHVADFFEIDDDVPFMEKVFIIKEEKRKLIPAVTHVDGTGRLQTVDKKADPTYHRLIEHFYEQTGIPILLNTSFNENEPIVNTPLQALDCYLRTQMDVLVLGNFVITRNK